MVCKKAFLRAILILITVIPFLGQSQKSNTNCAGNKNGVFHNYPLNTNHHFAIFRNGTTQKEINTVTGDSITWKVEWSDDCTYSLKYQSGKLKREEADLIKNHLFIYQILQTTADYYTINAYLDSKKNQINSDTVWVKEKPIIPDTRLYTPIQSAALRREHFSDTSQYAVLYIYRPGKIPCAAMDQIVNANNYPMSLMKTRTAYIFKIWKQGPLKLWSVADKNETSIVIPISFGKKYYISAEPKWKNYCPLDFELMNVEKGKEQFSEAGGIN